MSARTFVAGTAPGAVPVVGHAWQLMHDPLRFIASLSAHGDLVKIRIGPSPAYVPCHPELLRHVLTSEQAFDKGGVFYDRARDVAGNGLVCCPYSEHRRQRRLMQPAFQRAWLERYTPAICAEIEATAARWHDGAVFDAFPELYGLALRTMSRTLYSTSVSRELGQEIERAFEIALRGFFRQMFLPPALRRLPTPANRRYRSNLRHLHGTAQELITGYRRAATPHNDLLSALLAARDEDGGSLDDTEIHDQFMTIMVAGTETVAATLTWIFYLIDQNPQIAARLEEEIDAVLAGETPQWDDLPRLSLTGRVITETLRLYPPAWLATRETTADVAIAGLRLPPGTTVVFSPAAVAFNKDSYPHEHQFDPDRWLPAHATPSAHRDFLAFGTGARKCIGDRYATNECVLALATILSRWRVSCEPGADIRPVPLATVYHPRRLHLRLTRRTPHE